jgi:hypothetical protein
MASVLENTLRRVLEAAEHLDLNPGVRLKRNTMVAFRETVHRKGIHVSNARLNGSEPTFKSNARSALRKKTSLHRRTLCRIHS